ncbi:hypothetical protein G5C51_41560 [Streptomyces sp. A7024]|uniref:Extensin-like C-terminal domain-containing protein n=1 Tax=Streptomyces coryli TaxID=1128680 RepID=A0A6G4UEY7_9ACTN|nr:hypothetical protein [Streptomyces coryli]
MAAQYGGLQGGRASVLVAYRQWVRRPNGTIKAGGSAFDVRLEEGPGGWEVTALHPARPGRAKREPGDLAQRVLAHDRIHLPPAAAADVRAGTLRPYPMRVLLALADDYEIDVSIVHTGHPRNVFGTTRLSDHTRMRAFDVWAVNGRRVIDAGTPGRLIDGFLRRAVAAGAYNVGGPRQLSGGSYFSDRVHRDHLHIAFNRDD